MLYLHVLQRCVFIRQCCSANNVSNILVNSDSQLCNNQPKAAGFAHSAMAAGIVDYKNHSKRVVWCKFC